MCTILRKISRFEFILIYLSLLFFAGYYFFEYWTLPGIVIIAGLLMFRIKKVTHVQRNVGYVFLFMLFNILITEIITSLMYSEYAPSLLMIGLSAVNLILAFIFSQETYYSDFKENFINCMVAIAGVSLIAFVLYQMEPSIIERFPILVNSNGRVGHFMIFATLSDFSMAGAQRNQGIFWEPGAFQVFLNLAYIFELSSKNRKPRKWVIVLFLLSVITSYSTTGIIVAVALLAFTLSRHKETTSIIKAMIAVCIVGMALYYIIPKLTGFWQYTLVKKIKMLFDYQVGVSNDSSSRIDSIFYPLVGFLKSPLLGMGSAGIARLANEVGHSMFTCSPINWFAYYGTAYGTLVVIGIWKFFRNIFSNRFEAAVILLIFLVSVSSEALQGNIIVMTICFLGYTRVFNHPEDADETIKVSNNIVWSQEKI